MPGPDLSRATATVEGLMDDRCVIARDGQSDGEDWTLDETTGQLVADETNATVVTGLPCLLTLASQVDDLPEPLASVAPANGDRYRGLFPLSVPPLRVGDRVTILSSRRDPTLAGRSFIVDSVAGGTYVVARVVGLTAA